MAEAYSLDQIQPLNTGGSSSGNPIRARNTAFVVIGAIVIFGLIYWWSVSYQASTPSAADQQAQLRAQVAAMLNSTPTKPTQQEINMVASQLQSAPKTPTPAARASVAAMLRSQ